MPEKRTVTFLGDVWLPKAFKSRAELKDFVFNLEAPITQAAEAAPSKICLRAERNFISETFGRLPLAVCLANNHIMDYGALGFADTLAELRRAGIQHFGAGTLAANCSNPLLLEVGGHRIALLGYVCPTTHPIFATQTTPGVMPISLDQIRKDVLLARKSGASRVVVHLHWGMEEVHLPRIRDIQIAHEIAEIGADLIIGHHSHCIQSWELLSSTPIFYGLGNCIFPDFSFSEPGNRKGGPWMKQRFWNRRSLGVSYDASSGTATAKPLSFRGNCLMDGMFRTNKWKAQFPSGFEPNYQRRHSRHVRFTSLRLGISRFLSRPKFPNYNHMKLLFGR